jgi:hypothetical protein
VLPISKRRKHKDAAENSAEKHLFEVALSFVQLQQKRELADYDHIIELSLDQARLAIVQAETAFRSWEAIRNEQITQDYLFSLLIKDRAVKTPEWNKR